MATVTISRHFGAGGATLGARVAKRLGYRYINDELIKEVAKHVGASVGELVSLEKKSVKKSRLMSFLEKVVKTDIIERRRHRRLDVQEYVNGIKEVILRYYNEGNVVIVGRGSNYVLQGKKDVIHVLVVASKDFRIKFLVENYGLTEEQAKRAIERADLIRESFLYYFSGKEYHDDPMIYTVCLNMDQIPMEKAEQIIVSLVKEKENER